MKTEIKILKDAGFDSIKLVASFNKDDLDFKNMYVAKFGKYFRFVQIDKRSDHVWSVGDPCLTLKSIMSCAYNYLNGVWGFKEEEVTEEVKKAHQLAVLGFEITREEIGAIEYARDRFASPDQSEMAEINAYYLSKLLKKLKNLKTN